MTITTIAGQEVHVNDEGFMTEYDEWTEAHGRELFESLLEDLAATAHSLVAAAPAPMPTVE